MSMSRISLDCLMLKGWFGGFNSCGPLYRALAGEGYRVEASHPKKTRYIAEARIKSDRVDSRAIADW